MGAKTEGSKEFRKWEPGTLLWIVENRTGKLVTRHPHKRNFPRLAASYGFAPEFIGSDIHLSEHLRPRVGEVDLSVGVGGEKHLLVRPKSRFASSQPRPETQTSAKKIQGFQGSECRVRTHQNGCIRQEPYGKSTEVLPHVTCYPASQKHAARKGHHQRHGRREGTSIESPKPVVAPRDTYERASSLAGVRESLLERRGRWRECPQSCMSGAKCGIEGKGEAAGTVDADTTLTRPKTRVILV